MDTDIDSEFRKYAEEYAKQKKIPVKFRSVSEILSGYGLTKPGDISKLSDDSKSAKLLADLFLNVGVGAKIQFVEAVHTREPRNIRDILGLMADVLESPKTGGMDGYKVTRIFLKSLVIIAVSILLLALFFAAPGLAILIMFILLGKLLYEAYGKIDEIGISKSAQSVLGGGLKTQSQVALMANILTNSGLLGAYMAGKDISERWKIAAGVLSIIASAIALYESRSENKSGSQEFEMRPYRRIIHRRGEMPDLPFLEVETEGIGELEQAGGYVSVAISAEMVARLLIIGSTIASIIYMKDEKHFIDSAVYGLGFIALDAYINWKTKLRSTGYLYAEEHDKYYLLRIQLGTAALVTFWNNLQNSNRANKETRQTISGVVALISVIAFLLINKRFGSFSGGVSMSGVGKSLVDHGSFILFDLMYNLIAEEISRDDDDIEKVAKKAAAKTFIIDIPIRTIVKTASHLANKFNTLNSPRNRKFTEYAFYLILQLLFFRSIYTRKGDTPAMVFSSGISSSIPFGLHQVFTGGSLESDTVMNFLVDEFRKSGINADSSESDLDLFCRVLFAKLALKIHDDPEFAKDVARSGLETGFMVPKSEIMAEIDKLRSEAPTGSDIYGYYAEFAKGSNPVLYPVPFRFDLQTLVIVLIVVLLILIARLVIKISNSNSGFNPETYHVM